MADVEDGAVRLADEVAHAAPAVERDDQLPALAVDDQLLDAELVGEADPAVERRDDGLDVAPLVDQPGELVDGDFEVDRLLARPRRVLGPEAERAVVGPLDREADVDDPGEHAAASSRVSPASLDSAAQHRPVDDVEDGRRVGRVEPERTGLARLREQAEQFRQCERFQSSLQHDFPRSTRITLVHRPGGPRGLSAPRSGAVISPGSAQAGRSRASSAAARIDRDRRRPAGPALDLERGLVHEHAETVDDRRAPGRGRREQRGLDRVVHEVGQRPGPGAAPPAASGSSAPRPMRRNGRSIPIGVALTTRSRRRRLLRRGRSHGDARAAREPRRPPRPLGFAGAHGHPRADLRPARAPTARAAPPAPSKHDATCRPDRGRRRPAIAGSPRRRSSRRPAGRARPTTRC